jgi:hypothetical protein
LTFPQQAVQACHACIEVARSLPPPFVDRHPCLVLCGVQSEQKLQRILARLERLGLGCRPFLEPDLGNSLTAIATHPVRGPQRRWFRRYQCLNTGSPANSASLSNTRGGPSATKNDNQIATTSEIANESETLT